MVRNESYQKRVGKNNPTISHNVLYVKKRKIYPSYIWKHNVKREKQVILLMIPNGEVWYYIAVKKLSALLREISSKHDCDYYCSYLYTHHVNKWYIDINLHTNIYI